MTACPYRFNDKCNIGCRGFQCRHRDETRNVEGPAHLAPKPAPGLEFDERGVLVPKTQRLDLFAAFGAADAAKEQDLRGYYPMAARVLAEEVRRLRRLEERVKVLYGICTDEKCNAVDIRTLRAILGQEASK